MAVPTSYTEQQLAEYMHTVLGAVAADLGFTTVALGSYAESVNSALIVYGNTDISTITALAGIAEIRALARVQAWKLALSTLSAYYDFSDGTQSLKRSQMFAHAQEALAMAESEAAELGGGDMAVGLDSIHWSEDPYATLPDALVP